MHDLLSELVVGLFELVGLSVDGKSERTQALAMFAFCGLFSGVAGGFCSELAATVWFVIGGIFVVSFVVAFWFAD